MPIKLSQPISVVVNDIGDTFVVESAKFNFSKNEAEFHWRIKTKDGKVLKQGMAGLIDIEQHKEFTEFYNEEYKTHADLVKKVAELTGYAGTFHSEDLI